MLPGVALQELWAVIGTAERALAAVAIMVVLTAIVGLVATILATLEQRRREIAILRSLGARPLHVAGLLIVESGLVTFLGLALGVVIITLAAPIASPWLQAQYGLEFQIGLSSRDVMVLTLIFTMGILAALLPAWRAYRMSLSQSLGETAGIYPT